jgi:CarboxypepD_reg-like domain
LLFQLPKNGEEKFETGAVEEIKTPLRIDIQDVGNDGEKMYVRGRVKDENGNPISAANVIVAGTTGGTITKDDGSFAITMNKGKELVVSHIGFDTGHVAF